MGGAYSPLASLFVASLSVDGVVPPAAKSYVIHRCVLNDFSNASEAATNASSKIRSACFSNTSRNKGLVSTPTRAKEFPQYSQCSKTDANAPPSSTRCNVSSKAFLYDYALCEVHTDNKIADSSAVTLLLLLLLAVTPVSMFVSSPSLKIGVLRHHVKQVYSVHIRQLLRSIVRRQPPSHLIARVPHEHFSPCKNALLSAVSFQKYSDLTVSQILKHSATESVLATSPTTSSTSSYLPSSRSLKSSITGTSGTLALNRSAYNSKSNASSSRQFLPLLLRLRDLRMSEMSPRHPIQQLLIHRSRSCHAFRSFREISARFLQFGSASRALRQVPSGVFNPIAHDIVRLECAARNAR